MRLKKLLLSGIVTLLTSCSQYRSTFDCPPGRGVPCTSVSEIESRIIETEQGPDIFAGCHEGCSEWKQKAAKLRLSRVWIEESTTDEGHIIEGHYLYFNGDDGC